MTQHLLTSHSMKGGGNWVFCSYCIYSPVPAVTFCLTCDAHLCDGHLRVHSKSPAHVFSEGNLSRKCSIHEEALVYPDTEDTSRICATCLLAGEHQGHQVTDPSGKLHTMLTNAMDSLKSEQAETKKRLHSLQEWRRDLQEKAAGITKRVVGVFRDLRRQQEDLEERVLSDITMKTAWASLLYDDVIQQLDIKMEELSMKMRHVQDLCTMTDPLPGVWGLNTDDADVIENNNEDRDGHLPEHYMGDWNEGLITQVLHEGLAEIVNVVTGSRTEDITDISLDADTAADNLYLSPCFKAVSTTRLCADRPQNPTRFQANQVLSSQYFPSGKHLWDVETHFWGEWKVGVCYPTVYRDGGQSFIGMNDKSWCLWSHYGHIFVLHGGRDLYLPLRLSSHVIRICLDYEAGRLSFYELGDPIRHLHSFTATFTEPLHAAFYVDSRSWLAIKSYKW